MMTPSNSLSAVHSVSAALEAHARSQRDASPGQEPRVADEPRTIAPAVAEVIRNTFGA
jgi:hypothetical protein